MRCPRIHASPPQMPGVFVIRSVVIGMVICLALADTIVQRSPWRQRNPSRLTFANAAWPRVSQVPLEGHVAEPIAFCTPHSYKDSWEMASALFPGPQLAYRFQPQMVVHCLCGRCC